MNNGKYVFSQIVAFLPKRAFDMIVKKNSGDKWVKTFTCWNQLLVMMFGQLAACDSLRELACIVQSIKTKGYHLGFGKGEIKLSNLSYANINRDYRIFEEFAYYMINLAQSKRILRPFELENLESIKSYYTRKVSRDHRYLVQYYMTDTVDEAASKQALTQLLEIGLKPEAYYQLAFMHLEDGNPLMGEQLLNSIPNEFELNSYQAAEFSSMMDYYAIRKQMQQNNQYLNNLNETQLDDLIEIATNGTGFAKGYACSILNLYGLCDFTYDNLKNSSVNGESFAENKALEYKRLQKAKSTYRFVSISPNPATDFLTVQIPEVELSENALIEINSTDGKLIKQIELNTQQFETIIDVSELLPGAYILNLLNNSKLLESNRFIIVE
ncbi:MAG: hypothetical protein PWQ54_1790 [Bacteroidales bacterium]|jgi:hypothetical protein|nr:hypothetical protein [Bacteroidales bacterium]